jgi:amino acid transporter
MIKITALFQKPSMNPSPPLTPATRSTAPADSGLHRGISTGSALGINIIDMVGVGPFVTLPLLVIAMGGPPAILGWVLGALLSLCDGLIWSELGTAYPEAGGSYVYIKHLFGGNLGRALAFLYAWQLLFSAPLSIASGCIGFSQYASYFLPNSGKVFFSITFLHVPIILGPQTLIAMGVCLAAAILLHRRIESLDRIVKFLGVAVVLAILWIIFVGFTHFNPHRAFDLAPGAFHLNHAFFNGLGLGLLISAYDYWGYYNVCFLGAEVRNPQRTIPRAVLGSIVIVATLYILMNISVLGVIPWREFSAATGLETRMYTMANFMEHVYGFNTPRGHAAASAIVILIALAASASVLALLLGYSRIPYAAAQDGNFHAVFGRIHDQYRIPHIALRTIAGITIFCCLFRLQDVISSLVVIRILFQFLLQGIAVLLPRHRRARKNGAFKMPLYPLPVILALTGFVFILFSRPRFFMEMRAAGVILLAGAAIYAVRPTRTTSLHR